MPVQSSVAPVDSSQTTAAASLLRTGRPQTAVASTSSQTGWIRQLIRRVSTRELPRESLTKLTSRPPRRERPTISSSGVNEHIQKSRNSRDALAADAAGQELADKDQRRDSECFAKAIHDMEDLLEEALLIASQAAASENADGLVNVLEEATSTLNPGVLDARRSVHSGIVSPLDTSERAGHPLQTQPGRALGQSILAPSRASSLRAVTSKVSGAESVPYTPTRQSSPLVESPVTYNAGRPVVVLAPSRSSSLKAFTSKIPGDQRRQSTATHWSSRIADSPLTYEGNRNTIGLVEPESRPVHIWSRDVYDPAEWTPYPTGSVATSRHQSIIPVPSVVDYQSGKRTPVLIPDSDDSLADVEDNVDVHIPASLPGEEQRMRSHAQHCADQANRSVLMGSDEPSLISIAPTPLRFYEDPDLVDWARSHSQIQEEIPLRRVNPTQFRIPRKPAPIPAAIDGHISSVSSIRCPSFVPAKRSCLLGSGRRVFNPVSWCVWPVYRCGDRAFPDIRPGGLVRTPRTVRTEDARVVQSCRPRSSPD